MAIIEEQLRDANETRPKEIPAAEWELRVQLAACYRIFAHLGWTELIFNHISLRVPGEEDHLLINPFGLRYQEVTASNLVKVDLSGNIVGHSDWPVNQAGIIIHTAIHSARPDVHAVMHTHTTAGSAVAGLKGGLDPNNFYSSQLYGQITYHDFEGITLEADEQERLVSSLGDSWVMVLRNHGLLAAGATLPAAFLRQWTIERACEIQIATMSAGAPLSTVSEAAHQRSASNYKENFTRSDAGLRAFEALQREVDLIDSSYRS